MKKKVIVGLCFLLAIFLLFPVTQHLKDGGTIEYNAILYSVQKVHKLKSGLKSNQDIFEGTLVKLSDHDFLQGTIVEILGFEVFNNVE